MRGGAIIIDEVLNKIVSIGFELESSDITPIKIEGSKVLFESEDGKVSKIVSDPDAEIVRSVDRTFGDLQTVFTPLEKAGMMALPERLSIYQNKPNNNCICCDATSKRCNISCKCPGILGLDKGRFERNLTTGQDYQIIFHTEFKVTYLRPERSENILLTYFSKALNKVSDYFANANVDKVYLEGYHDKNVNLYQTKDGKDAFISITDPKPSQPSAILDLDIRWHTQCTIGVKLEDIQDVVLFLGSKTTYDLNILQKIYETYQTKHRDHYKKEPSALEAGFYFLTSMFDLKFEKGYNKTSNLEKDYKLAVRHNLMEVYTFHDMNDIGKNIVKYGWKIPNTDNWNDIFKSVGQIPYNGVVLIEMRDFYDQFLNEFRGWKEKDHPDGQSLQFFNDEIERYLERIRNY